MNVVYVRNNGPAVCVVYNVKGWSCEGGNAAKRSHESSNFLESMTCKTW